MRLMAADTARYTVKRPAAQADSNYFGSKNVWSEVGYVIGQLTQTFDKFTVELYGDKCLSMYALICAAGANIRQNDRVILDSGEYTVASLMQYSTHVTAMLQKAEV